MKPKEYHLNLNLIYKDALPYLILIPFELNGIFSNFLLDTGANQTSFDLETIRETFNLKLFPIDEKGIGLGTIDTNIHKTEKIGITLGGKLKLPAKEYITLDLQNLVNHFDEYQFGKVAGVFGMEELSALNAIINLPEKRMTVTF